MPHQQSPDPALAELSDAIDRLHKKADRNKAMARIGTSVIVIATSGIPVMLLASERGDPFVLGKLVPGILAAVVAAAAGFLQFERPREYWKLYRGYEISLRVHRLLYVTKTPPYDQHATCVALLATALSESERHLEHDWEGLMPPDGPLANVMAPGAVDSQSTSGRSVTGNPWPPRSTGAR